ncbi:MAG: hypothetical protein B7Y64_18410 [Acidovorax sp. 35-64-16]|nr:MAG: hypothetical protein B7Y64_18410 [Acidovorax sp. 35-64-16]
MQRPFWTKPWQPLVLLQKCLQGRVACIHRLQLGPARFFGGRIFLHPAWLFNLRYWRRLLLRHHWPRLAHLFGNIHHGLLRLLRLLSARRRLELLCLQLAAKYLKGSPRFQCNK